MNNLEQIRKDYPNTTGYIEDLEAKLYASNRLNESQAQVVFMLQRSERIDKARILGLQQDLENRLIAMHLLEKAKDDIIASLKGQIESLRALYER